MDEALSREEALKGMTIWAAIANFEETNTGSLEIGKQADLVILDRDIMTCNQDQLLETSVLMTWIDGELFYEN